jgi:hypothetical protein
VSKRRQGCRWSRRLQLLQRGLHAAMFTRPGGASECHPQCTLALTLALALPCINFVHHASCGMRHAGRGTRGDGMHTWPPAAGAFPRRRISRRPMRRPRWPGCPPLPSLQAACGSSPSAPETHAPGGESRAVACTVPPRAPLAALQNSACAAVHAHRAKHRPTACRELCTLPSALRGGGKRRTDAGRAAVRSARWLPRWLHSLGWYASWTCGLAGRRVEVPSSGFNPETGVV